jgi:hypothetical protein
MSYDEKLNEEALTLETETTEEPLFDTTADEEMEIEFEIEESEPAKGKIAKAAKQAGEKIRETYGTARDAVTEKSQELCTALQGKYTEARTACKDLMDRLAYDMKETDYNPYIRSTTTYRYEILRKSTDEEPVDVFEFQRTSGFSLRAMAITTALVAAADLAVAKIIKKKF